MSAEGSPKVSVVIPAFNSERYLRTAIESVRRQTFRDCETIVVDDGSTDETQKSALGVEGPMRYIYQSNQGPSGARNTGIGAARGELICFLDADDSWMPDKLQRQVDFMDNNPGVGLVFSDEEEFDDNGVQCPSLLATSRFYGELANGAVVTEAFQKLLEENFIPTSTVIVRSACFDATGTFDVSLKGPEDRDMWSRIAVVFPVACLPVVLGRKRVVPSSVSRDVETTLRSRIRLWTKARRLFPQLAPVRVINALLAPTYVQLGFVLLHKNKRREARQVGWRSLRVSHDPYEWLLATSLIIFTLTGRRVAESVFRTKRRFWPRKFSPEP